MKENIKIVALSGSLRKESYNRKVLQIAKKIIREAGMEAAEIDLKDLDLPVYDADIESLGFPESVRRFRENIREADVLIIATPEYNHSITGALKNAIDWLSTGTNVLNEKCAAIFGASTGPFGTMRAQIHLRQILTALNVTVAPQPQVFIRYAAEAFNSDGSLKDRSVHTRLAELLDKTLKLTSKKSTPL